MMRRLALVALSCSLLCNCGDDDDDGDGKAGASGSSSSAGSGSTAGSNTASGNGGGGATSGGSASTAGTAGSAGSGGGGPQPDALLEGKLAGAASYTCAIDSAKKVVCWGIGTEWDPGSAADADKQFVATGGKTRCAIATDGSVTCVGGNLTKPDGSFKQIAVTNNDQGCGIASDDTLECWGSKGATWTLPPGKFKFISAGADYVCAVSDAGAIACFGEGAAGMGETPAGTFERVYADELTACGVNAGTLSCWGSDAELVPASTPGAQVAMGDDFVCVLESTGKITCFGPDIDVVGKEPVGNFSAIAAGRLSACAFSTSHQLVCWGPGSGTPPADFVAP